MSGRPTITCHVDGVAYKIRKVDPFDALRVDALGLRLLGPVFRALATSDTIRGTITALVGGDAARLDGVLEQDLAIDVAGVALEKLADRIDPDAVVKLANLLVVGHVTAPLGDAHVDIDDDDTYKEVIGSHMAKHGHWHQLKLLWACVRVNLGPTTAALATSSPVA